MPTATAPHGSPEYERTAARIRCVERTLAGLHQHEQRERGRRDKPPVDVAETIATFERELRVLERRLRSLSG
jgi:hypothetical protein